MRKFLAAAALCALVASRERAACAALDAECEGLTARERTLGHHDLVAGGHSWPKATG